MQRALLFRAPHACALLLWCFAVTLLAPVTAKPSTLYISSPLIEADPLAICNDGSSQMYYFKQATHAKMATVWLVYLAPGLWCWNASSCALRLQAAPWDTGSSKWPATRKLGGLFDDDPYRNPLAGANMAYVGYCTSDAYAGDTAATEATAGMAFRGAHTVPAILGSLAHEHGMGTTGTPEQVILAGCAAGGRGVLYNLDYANQYVAHSVTVRGIFDSAVWLDVPPLGGGGMTLQEETAQMLAFTNASGRLSIGCGAAYTGTDAWKCLYGQYRLPYVKVPFFAAQAQFDNFQLPQFAGTPPPYFAAQAATYAAAFGATMATFMNAFPMGDQPYSGVWAPACYTSCMSLSASFYKMAIFSSTASIANVTAMPLTPAPPPPVTVQDGQTFNSALHSWLWDKQTPRDVELCPPAPATPGPLPWCGTCRNKNSMLYDEFIAYRKDNRPPAPPTPPPLSRLAEAAGGSGHLVRFSLLCLFAAVAVSVGASYARHLGASRSASGSRSLRRGGDDDLDTDDVTARRRLLRAGDIDYDDPDAEADESGDNGGAGGKKLRFMSRLQQPQGGGSGGALGIGVDAVSGEYPRGARGALARLATDMSTAGKGQQGRNAGWKGAGVSSGGKGETEPLRAAGAAGGGGLEKEAPTYGATAAAAVQQSEKSVPPSVGAKAAALMRTNQR